jgi:hypothetical protein
LDSTHYLPSYVRWIQVILHTSASFILNGYANRILPSSTVALYSCLQVQSINSTTVY